MEEILVYSYRNVVHYNIDHEPNWSEVHNFPRTVNIPSESWCRRSDSDTVVLYKEQHQIEDDHCRKWKYLR